MALAPLAGFAAFGFSGGLAWARSAMGWIAFQIRATAFLRSANLLTCWWPEMRFQSSTNRLSGQSADTLASAAWESKWIVVGSPACAASSALANTVMLLSSLIVNVAIVFLLYPRVVPRCHIHPSLPARKQVHSGIPAGRLWQ